MSGWNACDVVGDILLFLNLEGVSHKSTGGHGMEGNVALMQLAGIIFIKPTLERCNCSGYENQDREG